MSELTELRLAVLALTNAFNNSNTGAHGGGNGGGKGVAAGVAGGIIEGSMSQSGIKKGFENSVKLMDVSFASFLNGFKAVFLHAQLEFKRIFSPNKIANLFIKAGKGDNHAQASVAFMDMLDQLDSKYRKENESKSKGAKIQEKSNAALGIFNGLINKAALTLTGFVAAGLADTVQGYQLAFELKRLAYQIADSVLPIILSFTRNLKLLNNYLDRQNRDRKPGEMGGLGMTVASVIAAPFVYALRQPLLGLTKFIGAEFSKTMAMVWGKVGGMRGLGNATGTAVNFLDGGAGQSFGAAARGAMKAVGTAGSLLAVVNMLYESTRIKAFDQVFRKTNMMQPIRNGEGDGLRIPDTAASLAKKKAEADAVAETPWRYRKKELGNGDRRDYTKEEKADLEKKYSAGKKDSKKDKADADKAARLESMLTTSFGNVTQLWEKMQSETTANPTMEVAEKSLDTLGYLLLNVINIKEWLFSEKQTTANELLTDTPER